MTAPFQTDHRTALAGLAIIAVAVIIRVVCSTRFVVLVARVISRREPMTLANNEAEAAATARREADALVAEAYRAMRSESA